MNHDQIKSTLLKALQDAGELLKSTINERRIVTKKSELSLVTATDKRSEEIIVKTIRHAFPDHAILTEESPPAGDSPCRWIIDPLDGTTNFAHTFPHAGVSIGFEDHGKIILGGVFDPFRNELFFGQRSGGATLNGKPITVSKTPSLRDSILATGFPYDRRERPDQYLEIVKAFMMKMHGFRRTGAAALDLCYVACGRFDGFWEFQLHPWDKAAAMLMIEEAGGRLSNFSGEPLTLEDMQNVASNGLIHNEMLEVLKPFKHLKR